LDRLTPGTELCGLASAELVLEAAVEDLATKRALFQRVAERVAPTTVLCTNTSSLPIDRIAAGLPAPERVVGMHFFNPPDKMPLVEIVRGPATSDRAIATVARLAVELGKFPVVVADRPGFLVNRCLAPYLAEAGQLLVEGVEPEALDGVLCQFGFPMGPARLLDEIGWDIALRVAETLSEAYGERMQGSELATAMVAAGQLGTKSGGGLYRNGKPNAAGRKVLVALRRSATRRPGVGPEQVLDRCL
jgi:3-hydroxyacyl-CoA dehydrogenase/enoyl-CoA hydratase/3-hydroxybutyryl-CoA epimerase